MCHSLLHVHSHQHCTSGPESLACLAAGALIGHPVEGVRVALTDGAAHAVDSSELAFKLACQYAFRDAYSKASPTVLEPIMAVEVMAFVCLHNKQCDAACITLFAYGCLSIHRKLYIG